MRFIENHQPVFTEKHLDHLERYRTSYGEGYFTPEAIAAERENVKNGNPSPRCGADSKCFEIYREGQHIGDIILILNNVATKGQQPDLRYELDFTIFHEFSRQGNAKQALHEFLPFYRERFNHPLEALVRKTNPFFDRFEHLLLNAGFVFDEDLGSDAVYLLK